MKTIKKCPVIIEGEQYAVTIEKIKAYKNNIYWKTLCEVYELKLYKGKKELYNKLLNYEENKNNLIEMIKEFCQEYKEILNKTNKEKQVIKELEA